MINIRTFKFGRKKFKVWNFSDWDQEMTRRWRSRDSGVSFIPKRRKDTPLERDFNRQDGDNKGTWKMRRRRDLLRWKGEGQGTHPLRYRSRYRGLQKCIMQHYPNLYNYNVKKTTWMKFFYHHIRNIHMLPYLDDTCIGDIQDVWDCNFTGAVS